MTTDPVTIDQVLAILTAVAAISATLIRLVSLLRESGDGVPAELVVPVSPGFTRVPDVDVSAHGNGCSR